MNDVRTFTNEQLGSVRVVELNGEPWFVGKDVAEALGYSNPRDALARHVDEEDKRDGVVIHDSIGREQEPVIINESGLYSLIMGSKLETARAFKRWVTSEVLPAIRKHGAYMIDLTIERVADDPDLLITVATRLKEERAKRRQLELTTAVQTQQIAELQPKASYYDLVLQCKDLVSISIIAKDYGWSAKKMNKFLHEKKVQFKQGKIWLLYQQYAKCGYTSTKTTPLPDSKGEIHNRIHTYWTQAGRLFIYDLLKTDGILPLIETKD